MLLRKPTFYFAILGTTATALLVARLNGQSPIKPPPIDPPRNPYAVSVAASGIIESMSENVSIGVPDAGLVSKVHVKVWDKVEEGEPLFSLDDRELAARLRINEANAFVAETTMRRLQDQLNRLKRVTDSRAVSEEEVRTKEHDVSVAAAQLEMARAQLLHIKVQLERLVVVAPRAGRVLQVNVRAGEYASATPKTAAMVLGDVEHLQVRADIDEQNAPRLQPGQAATAYLKGDTTQPIKLAFIRVEPYVVPKISLTGASTERVDTRVLQVIYALERDEKRPIYVGQQVDLYIRSTTPSVAAHVRKQQCLAAKGNL